jgi:predicted ATPase/DNA-binding SARP family transcriptional activator
MTSNALVYIELFGGLEVHAFERTHSRFRSRQAAGILAYLAYYKGQRHSREILADTYWPEAESTEKSRASLAVVLSSLRGQLEPSGIAHSTIIYADNTHISLAAGPIQTDVQQFSTLLDKANQTTEVQEVCAYLEEAVRLYKGPLLQGYYDDWILAEQQLLAERFTEAVTRLADIKERAGNVAETIRWCRQAVRVDPMNHVLLFRLITLLLQAERGREAADIYREVYRKLDEWYGEVPPQKTVNFITPVLERHPALEPEKRRAGRPRKVTDNVSDIPDVSNIVAASKNTLPREPSPMDYLLNPAPLPIPLTRLFGREEDTEGVIKCLQDPKTRLVTVMAIGGMGKTRLVLHVAATLRERQETVAFVALSSQTSGTSLPYLIAEALGIVLSEDGRRNPQNTLSNLLKDTSFTLVLDNFEHLIETDAVNHLKKLLQHLPQMRCLVTSQKRLPVAGEMIYMLESLPVPPTGQVFPPEAFISEFPSVAFFIDRAREVVPDFHLGNHNQETIATVLHILEGIPLAIELCATRLQMMTLRQILEALQQHSERFRLLASRRVGMEERHHSLRMCLDWSYNLLRSEQQRIFSALAIFQGGFSLQDAEAITEDTMVLDGLAELCDASLIRLTPLQDTIRFDFLETVQIYALEHLDKSEMAVILQRHVAWFVQKADKARQHRQENGETEGIAAEFLDLENYRQALFTCQNSQDTEIVVKSYRLALTLVHLYHHQGLLLESITLLEKAMKFFSIGTETYSLPQIAILSRLGVLYLDKGDLVQSISYYEDTLRHLRIIEDVPRMMVVLGNLGAVLDLQGEFEKAKIFQDEAINLAKELDDNRVLARVIGNRGQQSLLNKQWDIAKENLLESHRLWQATNDDMGIAMATHNLGEYYYEIGDFVQSKTMYIISLQHAEVVYDRPILSLNVFGLGVLTISQAQDDIQRKEGEKQMQIASIFRRRAGFASPPFFDREMARHKITSPPLPSSQQTADDALMSEVKRLLQAG